MKKMKIRGGKVYLEEDNKKTPIENVINNYYIYDTSNMTPKEMLAKDRGIHRKIMEEVEEARGKCWNCENTVERGQDYCEYCGIEL